MFHDVDATLRAVLTADVPIKKSEIDISFDRPTREWSGRLPKPTLNLFLFDIREREELKDDVPIVTRDGNGRAVKQTPPRRIDLAYMATVWTTEADDEHRILARVLASMYRQSKIAADYLQGELKAAAYPILTRVIKPDDLVKPHELWGVLDNDLHTGLFWAWTVPLDVFAPVVGPLVRTKEIRVGTDGKELIVQVGGLVHRQSDPLAGLAGVKVSVLGTGFEAETDAEGKFSFNLPKDDYTWRIQLPDGKAQEKRVTVPSPGYDVEV